MELGLCVYAKVCCKIITEIIRLSVQIIGIKRKQQQWLIRSRAYSNASAFGKKNRRRHLAMFNSSTRTQEKRSILYMAMSYSLAWSLIFVPYLIRLLFKNEALYVLIPALSPPQGLFNLIVYMSPKVRNAKNSRRSKLTWFQAIGKAWTSKGISASWTSPLSSWSVNWEGAVKPMHENAKQHGIAA